MANIKRINVNYPARLVDAMDAIAESQCVSRSAVIIQACEQYVQAKQFQNMMHQIADACSRLGTVGNNDAETVKQLEDFMRLVTLVDGK